MGTGSVHDAGTAAALKPQVVPENLQTIDAGERFGLDIWWLIRSGFPDTIDPVAYRVGVGERWFGVITDLGRSTTLVSQKLQSLSVAVLNSITT